MSDLVGNPKDSFSCDSAHNFYTIFCRKSETSTLDTLLAALLGSDGDPVVRHKLKPYTETDSSDLGLFMKVENTEASEMR